MRFDRTTDVYKKPSINCWSRFSSRGSVAISLAGIVAAHFIRKSVRAASFHDWTPELTEVLPESDDGDIRSDL